MRGIQKCYPPPAQVRNNNVSNNTAPGISSQFLNNLETWILGVDQPTAVVATGSVSGTATLYEYLTGTIKKVVVFWNGYKSAAAQTLALPVAFTQGALAWTGETQGQTVEFLSSGSAITMSIMNTLAASGGSQSPGTTLKSYSFAQLRSGFDTVRLTFTTTAAGGFLIVEGI